MERANRAIEKSKRSNGKRKQSNGKEQTEQWKGFYFALKWQTKGSTTYGLLP
jgi:hypothetical protein